VWSKHYVTRFWKTCSVIESIAHTVQYHERQSISIWLGTIRLEETDWDGWVDDRLAWNSMFTHPCWGKMLRIIKKAYTTRNAISIWTLYTSMVRPYLNNGTWYEWRLWALNGASLYSRKRGHMIQVCKIVNKVLHPSHIEHARGHYQGISKETQLARMNTEVTCQMMQFRLIHWEQIQ